MAGGRRHGQPRPLTLDWLGLRGPSDKNNLVWPGRQRVVGTPSDLLRWSIMQFGIFTVSDITEDPTTGRTPSEKERIDAVVTIAKHAEEIGLDVFALGEHHNPPFFSSSPTTTLAYIGAQTERILLSTSTTLITTNDPVKIAEDYAMLQHLTNGRVDLMMGRGNTGPVYPWFGKDIRQGIQLAADLAHVAGHLTHALLVPIELLEGDHPVAVARAVDDDDLLHGGDLAAVLDQLVDLGLVLGDDHPAARVGHDERDVLGIVAGIAGAMAPDARDRSPQ